MITRLMLRLLPVQVLLAAVGAVNGLVSGYFASNYVGVDAMSAVGLYSPANMLVTSIGTILVGGAAIICGKYLGQNEQKKLQGTFSLVMLLAAGIGILFTVLFLAMGAFDLTGFFTKDETLRPIFNRYLMGQAIGVLPLVLGAQLAPFLAMENRPRRTFAASIVYIITNLILNVVFVMVLDMQEMGVALSSSIGMWVFMGVQAQYFLTKRSSLKFTVKDLPFREIRPVFVIGFPGAATNLYQTLRGIIVNKLLITYAGSVGLPAFSAAGSVLGIFWAIPGGMIAVSRLLLSVSVGEEDRQTIADIMRVMMRVFIPIMLAVIGLIIVFSDPLSSVFFRDSEPEVHELMQTGLRILPFCMALSIFTMHFNCYSQLMGRQVLVNVLAVLDGVVCVSAFSALLTPGMGVTGVYVANVLNGIVICLCFIGYSWVRGKAFPNNMEKLLAIPEGFGVPPEERLDLSVRTSEEVVRVAEQVQHFARSRGIDERRAYYAALAMEEMAGNIVEHGFTKDKKRHSVDVRVIHKDDSVMLRIKDDCVPFDPEARTKILAGDDPAKNIGIRMIYRMIRDISYQNLLGLNVLSMKI
ncbi:MAG: ATP-binding protein [Lachnospiraceae bacterium]|nr:ATP-binding protein [Lachnospiraceae bacterium]